MRKRDQPRQTLTAGERQRRDAVERIRAAARAWQEADREVEGIAPQRKRVDRFVEIMLHELPPALDVPSAMRLAWARAQEEFPIPDRDARLPRYERAFERRAEAYDVIYSPAFIDAMHALRVRNPDGIETALVWLEANPVCFRSGYDKQRLLRYLRRLPLTEQQRERLRTALLVAVREGAGVEFRDYCRTAKHTDTPAFRDELRRIRDDAGSDSGARQRAIWMLEALGS